MLIWGKPETVEETTIDGPRRDCHDPPKGFRAEDVEDTQNLSFTFALLMCLSQSW